MEKNSFDVFANSYMSLALIFQKKKFVLTYQAVTVPYVLYILYRNSSKGKSRQLSFSRIDKVLLLSSTGSFRRIYGW